MKRTTSLAAAAAVGLSAVLLAGPAATAGPASTAEDGCYDVLETTTGASRLVISEIQQTGDGSVLAPWSEATPKYFAHAAQIAVDVRLEADSCATATYTLALYSPGAEPAGRRGPQPLRVVSMAGNGTGTGQQPLVLDTLISDLPLGTKGTDACVGAQVTVTDPGGAVVDTAPDVGTVELCNDSAAKEPAPRGGAQGFGG